jgi:uncharacterized RDD family membrane protein YckC
VTGTPTPTAAAAAERWRPAPAARLSSWIVDWLVVTAWLLLLTVLGVALRALLDLPEPGAPTPASLLVADLAIAVATVLPYLLYLTLTETSGWHATLGKRRARLTVADAAGGPPSRGAVWVRNLVKVAPWQLAHLGVARFVLDAQPTTAVLLTVSGLMLGAAVLVPALTSGRGLHDRCAGTRVQRVGTGR